MIHYGNFEVIQSSAHTIWPRLVEELSFVDESLALVHGGRNGMFVKSSFVKSEQWRGGINR